MPTPEDCSQNTAPLKVVREGTNQDQRLAAPLDPLYAPINERSVAYNMVFGQGYAALLKYFDATNTATGNWVRFFGNDVSVQLATVAIEDVSAYVANTKVWFDYLNNLENASNKAQLKDTLGFLY